jgi:hypothetical protein
MEPVIRLTREWHEWLGLEKMAEHRIKLAVYKSKHLANYLEHLSNCKNGRPLPTFAFLHDVILDHSRSSISISRAHEWAQEPELFLHHDTMIYNEYGGVNGEIE